MNNNNDIQYSEPVYEVYLDWFTKGRRKHVPQSGIYYYTTQLIQEQGISSWSIVLKLSESSHGAFLWFLVNAQQQVNISDVIDLMEGSHCIGQALVCSVKEQNTLSFWFETCHLCNGQGRLELCIDEKYNCPVLCCDECDFIIDLKNKQNLRMRQLQLKKMTVVEVQRYGVEQYARYVYENKKSNH